MEIKIGVQHALRELVLDSTESQEDVEATVTDAIAKVDGVLTLVDERGRKVIVPVQKLAYVEIAAASPRAVGFSIG